ncbi:MAG: hybrid sensor histidine kinase/response regulator [Coriobacteriia bacterium]|nr:hybrid sensor histidine kinase/response regulator [Coriobacteriia bacterium]
MVEFDRSVFIAKFQEEATDLLQRLNEGIITLEGEPTNRPLIDQWLRDAHTLKGSSRMVGLIEISDIAHRMEDVMVKVRDGALAYTTDMTDTFFEALDTVVFLAEHAGKESASEAELEGVTARLNTLAGNAVVVEPADEAPPVRQHSAEGPAQSDADDADTDGEQAAAGEAEDSPAPREADAPGPQSAQRDDKLHTKEQTTVRVRTNQVDRLLNLVSEVVISQIKAEQRVRDMRGAMIQAADTTQVWARIKTMLTALSHDDQSALDDDLHLLDELLSTLRKDIALLSKDYADDTSRTSTVVGDLQANAMSLRMLPVSTVFNTFPRAMRDLARTYKKDVELFIEGGDTELDKKVLEEINDPLIHIMRNAVDHGIEPAADRVKAGKPAVGTIRLSARQEGDHIIIEVSDDGAGIDPGKVKAAAVRKGYISESEANAMSDREARYLIFEKGFSTAAIITEISGRGVGMDVVREFVVERLKGSLDVESELGKGSTFRLTIPLTLAIIRALLLRVGGQTFALPTSAIEETARIERSAIIKVEGHEVIRRQRRTVPLVHLRDILGIESDADDTGVKIPVATLGFSGHRIGMIVDEFVGEQQIVIKTLGTHLKRVDNVAGVTILGAGEVVPILNVPDLMTNGRQLTGVRARRAGAAVDTEKDRGPRRILICEDSFTTRELERSIFEAAGYEVETATDGALGLTRLREGLNPDAVVTDVQMPNMTGFDLTRAIKADDELKAIPVIIVTSLERDEEKAEGISAGADAYITKSVFNQDTLLDTVERLIR